MGDKTLSPGASLNIPVSSGGILLLRSGANANPSIVVVNGDGEIREILNPTSTSGIFKFNESAATFINVKNGKPLVATNQYTGVLGMNYKWLQVF